MEIVAIEMKHRDMYIACQLSIKDVMFKLEKVALTPYVIKSHDDCETVGSASPVFQLSY